jgi:hypothetical protein
VFGLADDEDRIEADGVATLGSLSLVGKALVRWLGEG